MTKAEIPEGYKELSFNQPHLETLGPGYYKREDGNLYTAFYVKPENCNGYGTAHGGLLMALADFTMASSAMEDRNSLVTTISFHSEFIAPANKGSMLIIRAMPTKVGKSLGFVEGDISSEGKIIINFGGVVKKL
jgi:uncharacterized protein (TIGR00369 family)